MRESLLLRFFPIPASLEMPSVGIDISDRSIKFVELRWKNGNVSLSRFGEREIPLGIIEGGVIQKRDALVQIFTSLKKDEDLQYLVVSLPEEKAYVFEMEIPHISKKELRGSIELQIEDFVPVPAADIIFDYEVKNKPKEGEPYQVIVSALPRDVVESYSGVLVEAGLSPLSFEVEAQGLTRALIPEEEAGTVMVVDFGRIRSGFSIATAGRLRFTATVKIGGDSFVKAIQEKFNLAEEQARQLKEKDGLSTFVKNKDLYFALAPIASLLRDEITKYYNYWETHKDNVGTPIQKIILTGGDANVPGILEHLSHGLPVPLYLGNPWENVGGFRESVPEIHYRHSLRYVTAIGLALARVTRSH